jgi:hypothetical protein
MSLVEDTMIKGAKIAVFTANTQKQTRCLKALQKDISQFEKKLAEKDEAIGKIRSITLL